MEKFSSYLAKKITLSLGYTKEKEQVLSYGLIAMTQFFSILLIVSLVGCIANFAYECILIFLGVGFLRKSTGGAHSDTMQGCMIMSCTNITFLAFLSRYILKFPTNTYYPLFIYLLCYLICFYIIYTYVPLDSPNKRITSKAKIARLRKQSFSMLAVYFVATILFTILSTYSIRFQSIANSFCLLTLWQCFTVTPAGAKFIHFLDTCLTKKLSN
ncbi:MAG: accessory gene regulator B family protein [bacterium]|nr:accessory gene regulator B family protein [bacterium]